MKTKGPKYTLNKLVEAIIVVNLVDFLCSYALALVLNKVNRLYYKFVAIFVLGV